MKNSWCPTCNQVTRWEREFSYGTLLMVLLTGGLWLAALPFYKSHCTSCGIKWSEAALKSFPLWDCIEMP